MTVVAPYKALALQVSCFAINHLNAAQARERIKQSINSIGKQIKASKAFIGQDLLLVVLPEYFLTGFPMGETTAEWQEKACIHYSDEYMQLLQEIALDNKIFFSGNLYEKEDFFPQYYFQSSFIIAPEGKLILRYRRLNSMYAVTPHDVLDDYLKHYGADSLFPVADTSIGKLACLSSEEIMYPEIVRCLALNGAEVICHHTSEVSAVTPSHKNIAKLSRAIENMCYIVSANSAGIFDYSIPSNSTDAHSQIINYEGIKLVESGHGATMVANATLHIDALRAHRQRSGMSNYLSRQRNELFLPTYSKTIYPANTALHNTATRQHFINTQQQVINKFFTDDTR
jgi:deaminated glutathione amidase